MFRYPLLLTFPFTLSATCLADLKACVERFVISCEKGHYHIKPKKAGDASQAPRK